MSTIDNFITGNTNPTADVKSYGNKELTQNDFMTLLSAQLQHQDPMKPMENGEFIAEMAQFSELENSKNLTTAFQDLSNALMHSGSLQASLLVGKKVSYESDKVVMKDEGATIHAKDAELGAYKIEFKNNNNKIMHAAVVKPQGGDIDYTWEPDEDHMQEEFTVSIQNQRTEEFITPLVVDLVKSIDISSSDFKIELSTGQEIGRDSLVEIIQN